MKPVMREEILDYVTYGEQRGTIRAAALEAKAARRILVGEYFAFLFENHETVRYQIQEMVRVEQIIKEADIQHELKTYNELIHPAGTVGCTMLIGIDSEAERDEKLTAWRGLNETLYAKLPSGQEIKPTWDPRQVGDHRLSSVQYLTFKFGPSPPTALGIRHPDIATETPLTPAQRKALTTDLA